MPHPATEPPATAAVTLNTPQQVVPPRKFLNGPRSDEFCRFDKDKRGYLSTRTREGIYLGRDVGIGFGERERAANRAKSPHVIYTKTMRFFGAGEDRHIYTCPSSNRATLSVSRVPARPVGQGSFFPRQVDSYSLVGLYVVDFLFRILHSLSRAKKTLRHLAPPAYLDLQPATTDI